MSAYACVLVLVRAFVPLRVCCYVRIYVCLCVYITVDLHRIRMRVRSNI